VLKALLSRCTRLRLYQEMVVAQYEYYDSCIQLRRWNTTKKVKAAVAVAWCSFLVSYGEAASRKYANQAVCFAQQHSSRQTVAAPAGNGCCCG
jgi:hypothetical protein